MSHSTDVSTDTFSETAEPTDPDPAEGQGRGLLSRLREVFAPPDTGHHAAAPQDPAAGAHPMPGILNLRRLRIEDIAVQPVDIVAVPVTIDRDALVEVFRDSGLTRLPVYDGTLDHPLGLVNLKDFALRHGFRDNGAEAEFDIRALLRPLLFVPPSMRASVLLQKMQAERTHMALIIDEYGGTDGLVTIEDLLETIVGDIDDEHDDEEGESFQRDRDGSWLVEAHTELEEFEAVIGHSLTDSEEIDEEEIDTIGGLVFMLSGQVPQVGAVVDHPEGVQFEVIEADPRRIRRVRVRLPEDWNETADG